MTKSTRNHSKVKSIHLDVMCGDCGDMFAARGFRNHISQCRSRQKRVFPSGNSHRASNWSWLSFFLPRDWEHYETQDKVWYAIKVFTVLGFLETLIGLSAFIALVFKGIFSVSSIFSVILEALKGTLSLAEGTIRTAQTYGSLFGQ